MGGFECAKVRKREGKKLKLSEPFWVLGSLILDEDVDGKGDGGAGWDGAMGARRKGDVGC